MRLIYVIAFFCTVFLSGCSEDGTLSSKDQSGAQQVAIEFAQALISGDDSKAYSFTSKAYQKENTQQKLANDFKSNFEGTGVSSPQFKINQAKITSDKAYDESLYFDIPLGEFKNEDYGTFEMSLVVYVVKEGGHIKVSGINFVQTEDSSL